MCLELKDLTFPAYNLCLSFSPIKAHMLVMYYHAGQKTLSSSSTWRENQLMSERPMLEPVHMAQTRGISANVATLEMHRR